jgi:hypothetical protein
MACRHRADFRSDCRQRDDPAPAFDGTRCYGDSMPAPRTIQIAQEQAMFRALNEQLAAQPEVQALPADMLTMRYCECADPHCFERIYLSAREYEGIRGDSTRFAVAIGHVFPQAEHVVASPDGYDVVEKNENLRGILERIYPRKGAQV